MDDFYTNPHGKLEYLTTIEFEHMQKDENTLILWSGKYHLYRIGDLYINMLVPGTLTKKYYEGDRK